MSLNLVVQISESNTIITKDNQFEYGLNLTYSTYEKQKENEYIVSNYPLDS